MFFEILGGLILFALWAYLRKALGMPPLVPTPPAVGPRKFTAVSAEGYAEVLTQFVAGKNSDRLQVSHLHDLSEGLVLTRTGNEIMLGVSFLPLKEAPRLG